MRTKTLKSAVRRFRTAWGSSVESRYKAACIYAEAVNTWDLYAKQVFHDLEEFANWGPFQWRLLYQIGSGAVAKCYIDFNRPSLPLAMARRGIDVEEQERIFDDGLFVADISGKVKTVSLRYLQDKHLSQVWDEDGNKRTILQQIKWLQDHQQGNFEILPDGSIRVHHACYITPAVLARLLVTKPYPLSALDLTKLAASVPR